MFRPDPVGGLDILAGVMLLYTYSALPAAVGMVHAGFLVFKGGISMVEFFPPVLPVYVLGGAADVISAAILFTGRPPLLADYKIWIASLLFLKGVWTFLAFMQG